MFRLAHAATRLNAETASNGLDWLLRQQQLHKADSTSFELVHRDCMLCVRHYPAAKHENSQPTPVVLVPPLAVAPSIWDLLPEHSFVRYLCVRGFNVYLVDWARPDRSHDEFGLQDYALAMLPRALHAVRRHAGQSALSLVGYCMGGLFVLLHAGTGRDAALANIVTIATPIDLHDATFAAIVPRTLQQPVRLWRQYTRRRLHNLDPALFHVPRHVNALAFKLSSPLSGPAALRKLSRHLDDHDAIAAHCTMRAWLGDMRAYPGALVQDFIVRLWIDNALLRGPLQLDAVTTDIARIDCPVLAIAGETDNVVGQASTRQLLDRVASDDKTHLVAPGGHVGVLAGSRAADYCWPRLATWLAAHNGQGAGNAASGTPAAASSSAVSCKGNPITPE